MKYKSNIIDIILNKDLGFTIEQIAIDKLNSSYMKCDY